MRSPARLVLVLLVSAAALAATDLKPATLSAWNGYIKTAAASSDGPFLWSVRDPARLEKVLNGEIVTAEMRPSREPIPHGLIHDWIAAVYIPGATLPDVVNLLRDYNHYSDYYAPTITRSQLVCQDDAGDQFSIRYTHKVLIVTATLDACYSATYQQPDPAHWLSIAHSTRVQEIHNFGDSEQVLPPDDGHGYLWRIFSLTRVQQTSGGVIVEQEVIGLSRTIPAALRWLIAPAVERASRELIVTSLTRTRTAVLARCNSNPAADSATASSRRPPSPQPSIPAAKASVPPPVSSFRDR